MGLLGKKRDQLLPFDNSAGSRLSFALFGIEGFSILTAFTGIVKFVFVISMFFDSSMKTASAAVSKPQILLDYILSSQISSNSQVCI